MVYFSRFTRIAGATGLRQKHRVSPIQNYPSKQAAAVETHVALKGFSLKNVMGPLYFELCVESVEGARAAEHGGADRIELCSQIEVGGVTPSPALTIACIGAVSIPVHVLVRPRAGDFVFTSTEYDEMRRQMEMAGEAGARGVAIGVLRAGGQIDVARTRALVELARPMSVTFHRAFDETSDRSQALEDVIATGADSLLTSGGAPDVLSGAMSIARLAQQAGDRIHIIAGGGLRLGNLLEVVRRSGVLSLHGSLKCETSAGNGRDSEALERSVREARRLLREADGERALTVPEP